MWGDAAAPVERPSSERLPGHDSIGDQGVTVQSCQGPCRGFLPSAHLGTGVGEWEMSLDVGWVG